MRAEEAAIPPYCNDDKRESAEKMRLRRVRFIFVNLRIPYFWDTMYALKGDFLLKRDAIGRKITALHCLLAVEFWVKKRPILRKNKEIFKRKMIFFSTFLQLKTIVKIKSI